MGISMKSWIKPASNPVSQIPTQPGSQQTNASQQQPDQLIIHSPTCAYPPHRGFPLPLVPACLRACMPAWLSSSALLSITMHLLLSRLVMVSRIWLLPLPPDFLPHALLISLPQGWKQFNIINALINIYWSIPYFNQSILTFRILILIN